jgi:hypothetical protein
VPGDICDDLLESRGFGTMIGGASEEFVLGSGGGS